MEVKTGRSKWEKRTAVFVQEDGEPAKIVIYSYFLLGLGAALSARGPVQDWRGRGSWHFISAQGPFRSPCSLYSFRKPLIGQVYPLNNLSKLEVKQEKNVFVVKLVTQRGLKLTLKFGGKEAAGWAAAVVWWDSDNDAFGRPVFVSVETSVHWDTPLMVRRPMELQWVWSRILEANRIRTYTREPGRDTWHRRKTHLVAVRRRKVGSRRESKRTWILNRAWLLQQERVGEETEENSFEKHH